ncbi:alpha/beta hydrolase [Amycolatopsis sp. ATCC 39116]|uniref:alpha/beta hydrolase n=1 Tax=Amycolatopsis sp. (strain ATCC 39116 / 75iv2) TaxID=385957 RepID=UPI0002625955|nr:alpha/beta hydrolase [Amycolatopsis sp. ATCC 39116]
MAREDIEFTAQGATLRGWFYPAEGATGEAPCVVLQHGFSGVKEMYLDSYAELFQAAGLACLVYDHPGFGASDAVPGCPRLEIDPWQQVRFVQHAITYAQSRPEVDAERIGLWGSSYAGGHALVVAGIDRRVKAVVSQVPPVSGSMAFKELIRIDRWAEMDAVFAAERRARLAGAEPSMLPVVTTDPAGAAALPTPDAYEWCTTTARQRAPEWRNEVTLLSMEFLRGYEPGRWAPLIAPTPLLMIVAPLDRLADGQLATQVYEEALHPKKLVLIPGGHFDAYHGPGFECSAPPARDWFVEHLLAKRV